MYRLVPLNDSRRILDENRDALTSILLEVATSGRWLFGPKTERFARAFAEFCEVEFCLPVGNGTDALELALRSVIDLTDGVPEVITVANGGGYTTAACRLVGAVPVYIDVNSSNLLLDPHKVEAALGPTTQAVVVTHLYGAVVNVPEVRRILAAQGYGHVAVIEDCAQAHGAFLPDGRRVGASGDLATFSFYPSKNLPAMGDGGAIITASPERHEVLKQLHQYGWSRKYEVQRAGGRNSRLDEMQAAVLVTLLPKLDEMNARRREILANYHARIGSGIAWCRQHGLRGNVVHLAVGKVKGRDEFRRFTADRGVTTDVHYPILDCDQPGWRDLPMRVVGELESSRNAVGEIISLPCFPYMTTDEVNYVCDVLAAWSDHVDHLG